MPEKDGSEYFSSSPLNEAELRALRAFLKTAPDLEPLIKSYQAGSHIRRFLYRAGAWIVGAIVVLLGIVQGLKAMGWWPSNGGPAP